MRKKENNSDCGGCGCIFNIIFYVVLYEYFGIKSQTLYEWGSGLAHGFLIIPNFIIHTIFDEHWLYKAKLYTTGYNIAYYITASLVIAYALFRIVYAILYYIGVIKREEKNEPECQVIDITPNNDINEPLKEEENDENVDFFDKPFIASDRNKKEMEEEKKEDGFDFFEESVFEKEHKNKDDEKKNKKDNEFDFFNEPISKK